MTAILKTCTLFLILVLVASGCDAADTDNVTFVVVTSDPQTSVQQVGQVDEVVAQQPTSVRPTAATAVPATSTPDIDPEVALQIGDRYLLDGYYEQAVQTYQAILQSERATTSDVRAAAAYGQGQAALREGLFLEAVNAFTTLIEQFPQDFRATQAYFLRGDAYLGLSQWEAAIQDFQRYLTLRPGLIDSYAHERIGDAQLALERTDAAFDSYALATDSSRSLVPQLVLREKVARLHLLSGQVDEAVAQYDAILAVAQNAPYRAQIEFAAAEALLDAGRTEAGLERMQRVFDTYEAQPEAYAAMTVLLDNGQPLNGYRQGRVSYLAGEYEQAIEYFNAYTSSVPLSTVPAELQLLLGRAYRAIGNDQAALIAFQTLIEQYPTDPLFGDALLERGRTAFLNGEIDEAIARYSQIADTYPALEEAAAEALWRVGYLHGTNGRPQESREVFERLAERYPNSEQASSGLFIAASAALEAGDTASALRLYTQIAERTTGQDQASAYLQVGQLARSEGDQQAAEAAFARAIQAAPDSYYSARARDVLAGLEPFSPPARFVFEFDDLADVTAAEEWLRTTFGVVQEGPLWPLSPTLEADPRVVRGRELWAVGAYDAAETEFLDVLSDYRQDGLASYQLAIFMRILGAYYPSIVGAANLIQAANVPTLEAPVYIARMRYPAFYRDVVLRITQERGIDPLLMLSLIRHESLFDAYARGGAEEKGLTQVIPSTGAYIADQLAWPDYQHSDLFRPHAAISFGAYYLDEQLERFDQNTYAALAGYNAGPGRAIDWLELSGGDPDRFMSTITIDTVQMYIQRIYSNYNIYRELYGSST
jgi:soluble lytic murein transglycosylase